jgi:uncharacterized membrane protein
VIRDPVGVLAIAVLVVAATVWCERYRRFRKIGAAATSIIVMMILSNSGVLPGSSPVYDFFTSYGVMAGTALILLSVDLRSVRAAGRTMLIAFAIGAVGSTAGALLMGWLLKARLGDDTWKLAGQFAATYVGGGINFAAVGQAFGTPSELFSAGVAADVIVTAFWLVACLTVPLLMTRKATTGSARLDATLRSAGVAADTASPNFAADSLHSRLFSSGKPIQLVDAAVLVAVTVASIAVSRMLATWMPVIPAIIWLTSIALALAQIPRIQSIAGSSVIGNYLVLIFLACNGARSVVARIVEVGPEVFYFAAGTVLVHGIVIFAAGAIAGIDAGTLAIASQANVGGSSSAMAIATARHYEDRVLPGIIAGLIGTATANYLGLAVGYLCRSLF